MEERWDGEFGVLAEKLSSGRGDGTLSSYHKTVVLDTATTNSCWSDG